MRKRSAQVAVPLDTQEVKQFLTPPVSLVLTVSLAQPTPRRNIKLLGDSLELLLKYRGDPLALENLAQGNRQAT